LIAAINAIERRLKESFPQIRWTFFEPDCGDRIGDAVVRSGH
jgi:hypothetical protein